MRFKPDEIAVFRRLLDGGALDGDTMTANSLVARGLARLQPTGRMAAAVMLGRRPSDNEMALIFTLGHRKTGVRSGICWHLSNGFCIDAPGSVLRRFRDCHLAIRDAAGLNVGTSVCFGLANQIAELDGSPRPV